MSGIGHNRGPSMDAGFGFRRLAWQKARADLLPVMPMEIVRARVARARALGLPYRTYASIRVATGEDIIAFLFSSNALGLIRQTDRLPQDRAAKLAHLDAGRHATLARAVPPAALAPIRFDSHRPAPSFTTRWSDLRADMTAWLRDHRLPADRVVMVGDTALEREHGVAGRLAAYLPAETYFREPAQ